ncbi:MAG: TolC family protein [Bacteroidaceae bacterium]|nr:TolC family protein [Bacteroidaceae bacterium]
MNRRILLTAICMIVYVGTTGMMRAQSQKLTLSLDELFRTAEKNNTSIKSFQSAIDEADAGVKAANSERLPDLNTSLALSYLGKCTIMDGDFSNAYGANPPHFGTNFALQASWAVYTGGAITSGVNLAKLNAEMARLNAKDNEQNVRMLITGYYLQLHNLKNQEKVFEENITLTQTLISQTKKRQDEGVVLKNDITRYELQMEALRLGRTQVQSKAKIINHQLLTALGIKDDIAILTTEAFEASPEKSVDESYWQSAATTNSIALQKSQLGIRMSEQKTKLQKSANLPSVAIFAEDHLDGPYVNDLPPKDVRVNSWYVGVGVKYSLSSIWKNSKKVKHSKIATQTAIEQHNALNENIENAVQAAYTDYLITFTELETSKKQVELANENYDVISNRYSNGLALVTDMVDAQNQRLDAQLKLVSSRINVLYNYYNLKFVTGTL